MQKLKFIIKVIPDFVLWIVALALSHILKGSGRKGVLLIPAARLDGGFGEDIMITSFISNFSEKLPVTILTSDLIERNDYLAGDLSVTYLAGFKELNYLKIVQILRDHSELFVIGADIMDGTYGYFPSLIRLRVMRLAVNMGISSRISGFSISKRTLPAVRTAMKEVSDNVRIKARDIDSFNRLKEFIPEKNLLLTNDIAFICPDIPATYTKSTAYMNYVRWCRAEKDEGRMIVGVCPNSIQANKIGLARYVEEFANLLRCFSSVRSVSFVLLHHDLRPLCGNENDRSISGQLFRSLTDAEIRCLWPQEVSNGVMLKGYLKSVDFTVTGRMHFGISGLLEGKPMFGVSYANKFEGMLKLFNILPEQSLVDYTNLSGAEPVVSNFIGSLADQKESIVHNLASVRKLTELNGIH